MIKYINNHKAWIDKYMYGNILQFTIHVHVHEDNDLKYVYNMDKEYLAVVIASN